MSGLPDASGAAEGLFLPQYEEKVRFEPLFVNANEQGRITALVLSKQKACHLSPAALLTVSAPYPVTVTTGNDLGET